MRKVKNIKSHCWRGICCEESLLCQLDCLANFLCALTLDSPYQAHLTPKSPVRLTSLSATYSSVIHFLNSKEARFKMEWLLTHKTKYGFASCMTYNQYDHPLDTKMVAKSSCKSEFTESVDENFHI